MTRFKQVGAVVGCIAVVLCACSAPASSDNGAPEGVGVQSYDNGSQHCLVFTHDTMQGASIAVWCNNNKEAGMRGGGL